MFRLLIYIERIILNIKKPKNFGNFIPFLIYDEFFNISFSLLYVGVLYSHFAGEKEFNIAKGPLKTISMENAFF